MSNSKKLLLAILPFWLIFYVLIPPFQIPDEPEHYSYIQSLANFHYPVLPKNKETKHISDQTRDLLKIYQTPKIAFHQRIVINKPLNKTTVSKNDTTFSSKQAYHPPFYYLTGAVFYKLGKMFLSPIDLYFFTRLTSLIFYLIFVFSCYKLLKFFFNKKTSFYLSFIPALNPTILMVSIGVNPEIAVIAMSTVSLYFLIGLLKNKSPKLKDWSLLILSSSLAFYSKFNGIVIIPTIFFSLIFLLNRHLKERLKTSLNYILVQFLLIIPFFINNYRLYNKLLVDNFSIIIKSSIPKIITKTMMISYIFSDFKRMLYHIPGVLGWLDTPVFFEFQILFFLLFIFFLGMGINHYFSTKKSSKKILSPLLIHIIFTFLFLLLMAINFKINYWSSGLQGRYALIAMAPFIVFVFNGLTKFIRLSEEKIAYSLFVLNFLYYFIIIFFVLIPRYYV